MIVLIHFEEPNGMVTLCCPECYRSTFCCTLEYAAAMSLRGYPQEILCIDCGGNPANPPPLKELLARQVSVAPGIPQEVQK
jgi:hypothetical protein